MDAGIHFSLYHYDAQRDRAKKLREVLIRTRENENCEALIRDRAKKLREVLIRTRENEICEALIRDRAKTLREVLIRPREFMKRKGRTT